MVNIQKSCGLSQVPDMFQRLFPDLEIKQGKDTKSNFRVQKGMLHAKRYDLPPPAVGTSGLT